MKEEWTYKKQEIEIENEKKKQKIMIKDGEQNTKKNYLKKNEKIQNFLSK